jgi:hypothetical protein
MTETCNTDFCIIAFVKSRADYFILYLHPLSGADEVNVE